MNRTISRKILNPLIFCRGVLLGLVLFIFSCPRLYADALLPLITPMFLSFFPGTVVFTVGIEMVIYKRMLKLRWSRAAVLSIVANFFSGIIGEALLLGISSIPPWYGGFANDDYDRAVAISFIPAWIITVFLEYFPIGWLTKSNKKEKIQVSFIANSVSYVGIFIIWILLRWHT